MSMAFRSAERLLLLVALLPQPLLAQPAERTCAFMGIRRGASPPCAGEERSVLGRPYCVHVPEALKPGLPILLLLHGYASNGEAQSRYFDFDSAVNRRAFILVKPNGTSNAGGRRYWNTGRHHTANGPDDLGYLSAVLQDVLAAFSADPNRIFVVGHSNGAFMANLLACERSDRIAAIVSLAGAVNSAACHPSQPVSVLTVHGTADAMIEYAGGTSGFLGPYPSADETMAFWAKADGCTGARAPGKSLRLTCDRTTPETAVFSYAGCPAGIGVDHWKLDGIGHIPNFALPAWPDAVLDFLWAHPKAKAKK
jgi:polyhydroxybutyrate depolymerase